MVQNLDWRINISRRFLTKSRFKIGMECPTKLFYLDKAEYGNNKKDNSFLEALAEGGFQVGELAKLYNPGGVEVLEHDHEQSVAKTNHLLKAQSAIIFEAAICFEDFFVRIDVLKKLGNSVEVIEVKAKSFDPSDEDPFFSKHGKKLSIKAKWMPYLLDVAFQTFVIRKAFPKFKVSSYLMLADKSKKASVDGLNQRFLITKNDNGKVAARVKEGTDQKTLGDQILCKINVDEPVRFLLEEEMFLERNFAQNTEYLAKLVTTGNKDLVNISSNKCKPCEYRIDFSKHTNNVKSGFFECFSEAIQMKITDYTRPMVFDIWNFRKSQELLEAGCYYMDQLEDDDITIKDSNKAGLSATQRQQLQVQKVRDKDSSSYIDLDGLKTEFNSWQFPLHFIDFETTMSALPFNKGRRPYEQIAFQFSHHMVHKNGLIEHKNQYIHCQKGEFPNFKFVRALKGALDKDNGTIFRYSNHENTVLCQILEQLKTSNLDDAPELIAWIKTVTTLKTDEKIKTGWDGPRTMVDLCDLVKMYYYNPMTNGSNSIKKVLPAVLNESQFLNTKYSKPIYGNIDGIISLNFSNWTWLNRDHDGKIKDPYKLLPTIFSEEELEAIDPITNAEEIADGGAAMMAFAKMQFSEMSDAEAEKIQNALLKYCELDTFAMVMIYEHWKAELEEN